MITKPFLLNEDCSNMVLNSEDTHRMLDLRASNMSEVAKVQLKSAQTNSKIQYAFWIMASMQVRRLLTEYCRILIKSSIFNS